MAHRVAVAVAEIAALRVLKETEVLRVHKVAVADRVTKACKVHKA